MNKKSKPPKHLWLEEQILTLIESQKLQPGDLIPSERQISRDFKASVETTRKTLLELTRKGVIVRFTGKGTFVAPKSKRKRILVVYNEGYAFHHKVIHREVDAVSFFMGLLHESQQHEEYFVELINRESLLEKIDNLEILYPGVQGCIFFRQIEAFITLRPLLEAKSIQCLFYGSDTYRYVLAGANTHLYREEHIMHASLEHLIRCGYRRIGFLTEAGPVLPVNVRRLEIGRAFLKTHRLEFQEHWDFKWHGEGTMPDTGLLSEVQAIAGCSDKVALPFMREALKRGIRIPEDLAIVSSDGNPLGEIYFPSLTSVKIPVQEDAQICLRQLRRLIEGGDKKYCGYSETELVVRETTTKLRG